MEKTRSSGRGLEEFVSPEHENPPQVEVFSAGGRQWEYIPPSLRTEKLTDTKGLGMCDYSPHEKKAPAVSPPSEIDPRPPIKVTYKKRNLELPTG